MPYNEWGSGDNDTKQFDVGLNIGVGVRIKKLELGFSYEHGFIDTENVDYREQKNRAFMINCAYPLYSFKK